MNGLATMLQAPDWRTGSSTCGRVSLETRMKGTVSSAGSARMATTRSVPARSGRYRLLITTVRSCAACRAASAAPNRADGDFPDALVFEHALAPDAPAWTDGSTSRTDKSARRWSGPCKAPE